MKKIYKLISLLIACCLLFSFASISVFAGFDDMDETEAEMMQIMVSSYLHSFYSPYIDVDYDSLFYMFMAYLIDGSGDLGNLDYNYIVDFFSGFDVMNGYLTVSSDSLVYLNDFSDYLNSLGFGINEDALVYFPSLDTSISYKIISKLPYYDCDSIFGSNYVVLDSGDFVDVHVLSYCLNYKVMYLNGDPVSCVHRPSSSISSALSDSLASISSYAVLSLSGGLTLLAGYYLIRLLRRRFV